jgi:nucleoside-diphosphate-sugar epimerase
MSVEASPSSARDAEGSMRVLILGAAGMIGRKLTARLLVDGTVGDRPLEHLTLADVVPPQQPANAAGKVELVATDLAAPGEAQRLVDRRCELIFHLAAVVSGEAEADFEKGYRVNLDGTRALLEAVRTAHDADGYRPRLVFTSSIAVYGAPLPNPIPEEFQEAPLTSYGTQKAIGELLLADYTRRGFVDGIGLRLPTICIRPGMPNKAASGFFSSILREPLVGEEAVLPVPETVRHWYASPRSAVEFLIRAATLDGQDVGPRRTLSMPGLSATVGEQIEALRRVAGERAVRLIRREPDESVMRMVETWAPALDATRALRLGFAAESSFDEIIRVHIDDELGGSL